MSTAVSKVKVAPYPKCAGRIRFNYELQLGDRLLCPECDEPLEVVGLAPLRLGWVDEASFSFRKQHGRSGHIGTGRA